LDGKLPRKICHPLFGYGELPKKFSFLEEERLLLLLWWKKEENDDESPWVNDYVALIHP
jgi:hypothetical protein